MQIQQHDLDRNLNATGVNNEESDNSAPSAGTVCLYWCGTLSMKLKNSMRTNHRSTTSSELLAALQEILIMPTTIQGVINTI